MTKFDVDRCIELLKERKLPPVDSIKQLCIRAREILAEESNVLEVPAPVTIVGDIHGQFYDLREMFRVGGWPPETTYLFMGDYVDRGYFSVETLLLLQITQVYGFFDECMRKLGGTEIWTLATSAFDTLALAAVVGQGHTEARFSVHAGLTPSCDSVDQIRALERVCEVPHEGPMCDLLWSDPEDIQGGWGISPRGAGYIYGEEIVSQFNHLNRIKQITRSHQLVMTGYREMFNKGLVTVWSAPNYCYRCGNAGAVLELDEAMRSKYATFGPCPNDESQRPSDDVELKEQPDYFL